MAAHLAFQNLHHSSKGRDLYYSYSIFLGHSKTHKPLRGHSSFFLSFLLVFFSLVLAWWSFFLITSEFRRLVCLVCLLCLVLFPNRRSCRRDLHLYKTCGLADSPHTCIRRLCYISNNYRGKHNHMCISPLLMILLLVLALVVFPFFSDVCRYLGIFLLDHNRESRYNTLP